MIPYNVDREADPPRPCLRVLIHDEFRGQSLKLFDAVLDTGAGATCIPDSAVDPDVEFNYGLNKIKMYDFAGNAIDIQTIAIAAPRIEFFDLSGALIKVVEYSQPLFLGIIKTEGIIGRNILNNHLFVLNGPKLFFELD